MTKENTKGLTKNAEPKNTDDSIVYSATNIINELQKLFVKEFEKEKKKKDNLEVNDVAKIMDKVSSKYLTKILGFKAKALIEIVFSDNGMQFYYDGFIAGSAIKNTKEPNVKVIGNSFMRS